VSSNKYSEPRPSGNGPLAGTQYDFRKLYPELSEPASTPAPAPKVRTAPTATSRRGLFQMLRVGRAKP
jgi:hypothetical protein